MCRRWLGQKLLLHERTTFYCVTITKYNKQNKFPNVCPDLPVNGEWLACWLLLGHADNAGRAAVWAAQARTAHTVGPAAHTHALPYLRAHHVPGVHG